MFEALVDILELFSTVSQHCFIGPKTPMSSQVAEACGSVGGQAKKMNSKSLCTYDNSEKWPSKNKPTGPLSSWLVTAG